MTVFARIPRHYGITPEGWPFIGVGLGLALIGWALGWGPLLGLGTVFAVFSMAFFRNPRRVIPTTAGAVLAPGDGRVVAIRDMDEPHFGQGLMRCISIFLSVADVHINRTPIAGEIAGVKYVPGRFHLAYTPKASLDNERNAIWIRDTQTARQAVMVQIAGTIARRIVCYVRPDDVVTSGMRCGLIRFGSRIDLYLPCAVALQVVVGDRVRGGETIIGQFAVAQVAASA